MRLWNRHARSVTSIISFLSSQLLLEGSSRSDYNILWGERNNIPYFVDFLLDKPVQESTMRLHNFGKYGVPYRVILAGVISPFRWRVPLSKKGEPLFPRSISQFASNEEALQC